MTITDHRPSQQRPDTHPLSAGPVKDNPQTNDRPSSILDSSAGPSSGNGHVKSDTQSLCAVAGTATPTDQTRLDIQGRDVGGGASRDGSAATTRRMTPMIGPSLFDPSLALAADVLDDTERTKIANENRLRQLTRTGADKDGQERGFGLDETHPDVANLAALVAMLGQVEHQAVLQLQRKMRAHPLGSWCKAQRGIGDKQAARLLAVIGDPYVNAQTGQPRTVSALWAYAGYHVLPAGQSTSDAHQAVAGGGSTSGGDLDHDRHDAHPFFVGVAARRTKGQRANWSSVAKSRAYLIAESCMKAGDNPYRDAYDKRKVHTEGKTHTSTCVRCGPSGKPAQVGSPWSDGHRHADALRIAAKAILRDLWREARRIHQETTP